MVLANYAGSAEFSKNVGELRESLPNGIIFAIWSEGRGTVFVDYSSLDAAIKFRTSASSNFEIAAANGPSERERETLASELSSEISQSSSTGFSVEIAPLEPIAIVTLHIDDEAARAIDEPSRDRAAAFARERGLKIVYRVSSPDEAPAPAARGGLAYSTCTGGFIVSSSGVYGISTAQHCATKPATYDGSTTGSSTALGGRDVRWTRFIIASPSRTFQYDFGKFRAATGSGDPVVGTVACKFGNTTGYSCDTVESSGNCTTYAGWPQFCGLFRTANNYVSPGDSGGPWFYGNTARGITSGYSSGDSDIFSGIGSLNLLSLVVYTS